MKKYQQEKLPSDAVFAASTPALDERTVLKPMLEKHMAPRGKCGLLLVSKGNLQFVWEDTGEILDADPGHPVVIEPERYHHLVITGPVVFQVEFYTVPSKKKGDAKAVRPGEQFTCPVK